MKKLSRTAQRRKIVEDMNFAGNEAWEWQETYKELWRKLRRFDKRTKALKKRQ